MQLSEAYEILSSLTKVRFSDAVKVATHFFGTPRIKGSHHIFKTPWMLDPRVNLQPSGNKAKVYQVKQLIQALKKLEFENERKKEK